MKTRRLFLLAFVSIIPTFIHAQKKGTHMKPPGIIVDQSPDSKEIYIGSPSLAILPDGSYAASHDLFGPGTTYDTTVVLRSTDKDKSWKKTATLKGQFWSRLFVANDNLYILGSNGRYGSLVIRRSKDNGKTWTTPADEKTGIIHAASDKSIYGIAPGAILKRQGRLYKCAIRRKPGRRKWGQALDFFVLSAPADANLLLASNWLTSNSVCSEPRPANMFLCDEGNVIAERNGKLFCILRVHESKKGGIAGILKLSTDGRKLSFDREKGYFPFPGGCKKFTIRYDSTSDQWWSLTNWAQEESLKRAVNAERTRNTLALTSAKELRDWKVRSVILYHPDVRNVGFQYADWHFEGDDIIALSRTAFGDVTNCHNANYLTFHRIQNFRKRTMDSPPLNKSSRQK